MGRYTELWETLKAQKYVSLEMPERNHKTILKGLRIESLKDTSERFRLVQQGKSFYISHNSIGDLLLLRLEFVDRVPKKFLIPRGYKL